MTIGDVKIIAVVGAGTMGSQIALQAALSGFQVNLYDSEPTQIQRALTSGRGHLERRVQKGTLTSDTLEVALGRVAPRSDLAVAVGPADFVIEAVPEQLAIKREVFARLDEFCRPETIRASNSSAIVISRIVAGTEHRDRALNMHFFHPVLVMKLVEVVRGAETAPDVLATALDLAREMGKEPVLVEREIFGFIVNRILLKMLDEALFLVEGGYATPGDVDKAMRLGMNYPLGPFELIDFSGADVFYDMQVQRTHQDEHGGASIPPSETLRRLVEAGRLGRKTSAGFYEYGEVKR